MNKITFIVLINKIFPLFLENKLDSKRYQEELNSLTPISFDENLLVYKETELLCNIFSYIPYYEINNVINSFRKHLIEISENSKLFTNTGLINDYLFSLKSFINERLKTEITLHLILVITHFYQDEEKNLDKDVSQFLKNLYQPKQLLHYDIANEYNYIQENLFSNSSSTNLREKISKNFYDDQENNIKALKKYLSECLDYDMYIKFKDYIDKIFNILIKKDENFIEIKQMTYNILIKEFNKERKKIINKNNNNDLKLVFKFN